MRSALYIFFFFSFMFSMSITAVDEPASSNVPTLSTHNQPRGPQSPAAVRAGSTDSGTTIFDEPLSPQSEADRGPAQARQGPVVLGRFGQPVNQEQGFRLFGQDLSREGLGHAVSNNPVTRVWSAQMRDARGQRDPWRLHACTTIAVLAFAMPAHLTAHLHHGRVQQREYATHARTLARHPAEAQRLTRLIHATQTAPAHERNPLGQAALHGLVEGHDARTTEYRMMLHAHLHGQRKQALGKEPELREAREKLRAEDAQHTRDAMGQWKQGYGHDMPSGDSWVGQQVGIPRPDKIPR